MEMNRVLVVLLFDVIRYELDTDHRLHHVRRQYAVSPLSAENV